MITFFLQFKTYMIHRRLKERYNLKSEVGNSYQMIRRWLSNEKTELNGKKKIKTNQNNKTLKIDKKSMK